MYTLIVLIRRLGKTACKMNTRERAFSRNKEQRNRRVNSSQQVFIHFIVYIRIYIRTRNNVSTIGITCRNERVKTNPIELDKKDGTRVMETALQFLTFELLNEDKVQMHLTSFFSTLRLDFITDTSRDIFFTSLYSNERKKSKKKEINKGK